MTYKEEEKHPGEATSKDEEGEGEELIVSIEVVGDGVETTTITTTTNNNDAASPISTPPPPICHPGVRDRITAALTSPIERCCCFHLSNSNSTERQHSQNHVVEEEEEEEEEVMESDLDLEEDIGRNYDNDGEGFNPLDGAAVEQDDDCYGEKWDRYQIEWQALVDEGRTIICPPPKQQKLKIGTKVKERRGANREGIILDSDRDDDHDYPCWRVQFGGVIERHVKPSKYPV